MKQKLRLFMMTLLCAVCSAAWSAETWIETNIEDLHTNDIIVIVDKASALAMPYSDGTSNPPTATEVTLNADQSEITSEVASTLQWRFQKNQENFMFQASNSTSNYLYTKDDNNGVRVGPVTNNSNTDGSGNNKFVFADKFIKNVNTNRYVGVYIPTSGTRTWRCYTSINNNIKNNIIAFYKKVDVNSVATPTFDPAGGTYTEAQDVTINCSTSGATIYYTTDGTDPSATNGTVFSSPITLSETTTIKAIAVKEGLSNSSIASATYTITEPINLESDIIDFENDASAYVNWTFTNIVSKSKDSGINTHGGDYYGSTNKKESGSIQTINKVATPHNLSCFVSKQTNNTTASTWFIEVSSNGTDWEEVANTSASDMAKGVWKGFNADLSSYTDVYVRVRYAGTSSIRFIDDLTLSTEAIVLEQKTIAEVRTQGTGTVLTKGVVTSINEENGTAYIQDNTAGIAIYGDENLNVGDEITVQGTLTTYYGLLEITSPTCTVNSEGNTVSPSTKTITEINEDYAGSNMLQSMLVKIENATVIAVSGQNTTLQQGDATINVRNLSGVGVDDIISLTGIVGCYNQVQIVNPTDVTIARDRYYVAGTWTAPTWADGKIEMTKNPDGTYSLVVENLAAEAQFKIIKVASETSTWCGGGNDPNDIYWLTADNHSDISLNVGGGGNFYMPIAGTWTFTVNPSTSTLTVDGSWPEAYYYLMGDFNKVNDTWVISDDYKFTKDETTGKYILSATIEEGQEFKIIKSFDQTVDDNDTWYGAVSTGDFEAQNVGEVLSLSTPGNNFLMKLSNGAPDWNLTFDPATPSLVLSNYVDPNAVVYKKVTSSKELVVGEEYIIVCESKSKAMGKQGENWSYNYRAPVDVTISSDNTVNITDDVVILTLGGREGVWTFKANDKDAYLSSGSSTNELQNVGLQNDGTVSSSAQWIIKETDGGFIVACKNNNARSIQYNSQGSTIRFATYTSNQNPAYLYVKTTGSFDFSISERATDGNKYYATIADLGGGNYKVTGDVLVSVVNVENGKFVADEKYGAGTIIAGKGAYLVESSTPGDYSFPKVEGDAVNMNENMLHSTGEGKLSVDDMEEIFILDTGEDPDDYKFYKLSLSKGKVGFFYGIKGGGPFEYGKAHQAFLAVPAANTQGANAFFFDGTTDIDNVAVESEGTEAVFTLSGLRMDAKALPKGVYIVNGKKMVVK